MMPVKDKINAIIRSHEKSKHEHQQAKLLANIVRWFYLKNQKQYPFPDDWNKKVEEAFKRKDTSVKVKDRSGGEYEIDFAAMTEQDLKSKEKFTVIRRDVIAGKRTKRSLLIYIVLVHDNCFDITGKQVDHFRESCATVQWYLV